LGTNCASCNARYAQTGREFIPAERRRNAVILASAAAAEELGVEPLARMVAPATHALDPLLKEIAPAFAIPKALKLAGLALDDIDVWEVHEAYAAAGGSRGARRNRQRG